MKRVILADDDEKVRAALQRILEHAGLDVVAVKDGREALKLLRERPVDVILCDLFMPNMDGLEAIQQIRREFPDVKIIAISGGGQRGNVDMLDVAVRLGANAVLRKPVSPMHLMPSVLKVLEPEA